VPRKKERSRRGIDRHLTQESHGFNYWSRGFSRFWLGRWLCWDVVLLLWWRLDAWKYMYRDLGIFARSYNRVNALLPCINYTCTLFFLAGDSVTRLVARGCWILSAGGRNQRYIALEWTSGWGEKSWALTKGVMMGRMGRMGTQDAVFQTAVNVSLATNQRWVVKGKVRLM
jgi:hypothetical protein